MAVDRRHIATISADSSLRVWELPSLSQLYEVFSSGECPTTLAFHPYKNGKLIFSLGRGRCHLGQIHRSNEPGVAKATNPAFKIQPMNLDLL